MACCFEREGREGGEGGGMREYQCVRSKQLTIYVGGNVGEEVRVE